LNLANAGFLLGGLVVGILAFIALLDAVKGTPIKHVLPFGQGSLPGVRDPGFLQAIELNCGCELHDDNSAEFFWNGDQTYPRLWADLRAAQHSITLQMYYNKPGKMADMLSEILVERARAGVRVMLLYDAWGTSWKKEFFEKLHAGGVETEKFRPISIRALHHINHRAHIRVVCIDGRIGWTGGFGFDDKWFGNGRSKDQWRDSNVRFTGAAVSQLQAAFIACWAEASGKLLVGEQLYPVNTENGGKNDGTLVAGLLHASPSVGSTEAERFFALSIACAKQKLYITNSYFVPDRDFRKLICDAAKRGVDTRVLTVSGETDIKSTWYAGRARYEQLLSAGVRVFEYQPTMMHAKTLVVDGHWCAVGSMNADNRSLSFNEETVLMLLDDGATATVEKHFTDDLAHSTEILIEEFRKRGLMDRLKEKACYAFWRLL
jgi:cardiolipin synthase A/B